ncbi:MAG: hypothetical protein CMP70_04410 [Flavobacteriales bacterium]|nr:hypothetical protein [Flavobacteriales bacterium]
MKKLNLTVITLLFGISLYSQNDSICNPSFEDSLNTWTYFANNGAEATFDISSDAAYDGELGLKITTLNNPSNNCVVSSCIGDLDAGFSYLISFWAKSNINELDLFICSQFAFGPPWTNFGQSNITINSEWTKYQFVSTSSNFIDDSVRLIKIKPQSQGIYFIDNFQIEKLESYTEICDGGFETGVNNWQSSPNGGIIEVMDESSDVFDGNNSAKIIIDNTGGDPIFSSCQTDLQANINYRISFAAKSEDNIELFATSSLSSTPFSNYGSLNITTTSDWTEYSFISSNDSSISGNVRLAKFKFLNSGTIYLDNVMFEEIPPFPESCNNSFESGMDQWIQTIDNSSDAVIIATPTQAQDGLQSAMINVQSSGPSNGSIQISSCLTDISADSTYTVSFWAKGSVDGLIFNAITSIATAPYQAFTSNEYTTTTNWKEYCYTFSSDSTIINDIRLLKLQFLSEGVYYVDNVTIQNENYNCVDVQTIESIDENSINIYPNPFSNFINIDLNKSLIGGQVNLFDVLGRLRLTQNINSTNFRIDLSQFNLKNEVLFLKIHNKNTQYSKIILKN